MVFHFVLSLLFIASFVYDLESNGLVNDDHLDAILGSLVSADEVVTTDPAVSVAACSDLCGGGL